jgi:hypothetical protein
MYRPQSANQLLRKNQEANSTKLPSWIGGVAGFNSPPVLGGVAPASGDGVVHDGVALNKN